MNKKNPNAAKLGRYWRELGKYLGYPDCCIEWFVNNAGTTNVYQDAVHGNTGFIPCPECAKKVSKQTLHTLINNRQCPTPFPIFGGKERKEFQKKYL